jgi:hypothetical protein
LTLFRRPPVGRLNRRRPGRRSSVSRPEARPGAGQARQPLHAGPR